MPSKNCPKSLHTCQLERDIFIILFGLTVLFNLIQVVYWNRAVINRVIRRKAANIVQDDEDPMI
ncbi:hypothetical protein CRE_09856 [Caenorhabditis remanei]|uniref:Uncharacterized protein n=1 Tax=Caenorhabditis remanei TaxID=31234 RepID=E3NJY7_CAERE|nr:hypothetical protein CRE_09856 [Caenorhabditis remanei]